MDKHADLSKIVEDILQGEGTHLLKRLSPEEKEVAWQVLQEIKKSGVNDWINQLWALDYSIEPPTIKEFLESPEYFKHVGDDLYPKWKEEMLYFLDPANGKNEIIFRGCIGSGKTFVGAAIAAYDLCLLLHLHNPQTFLKHAETAPIYFALISSDLTQLEKMLWGYTLQMMKGSPFFKKHSSLKEDKDYKGLTVKFPKGIELIGGSLPPHVLGLNLYFACLDESNYRRTANPQEEAYQFYSKLRNRIENRFIQQTGRGRIVLISSEGDEGSFLDAHCNTLRTESQKSPDGESEAHICQFSEWEIKGHTMNLSGEEFQVDIGDQLRSPKILEDNEEAREGARIIEVPSVYRKSAERDLINFLKERAGVVPGRANKYFYNVEALSRSFLLHNPMLTEVAELALDTPYTASDYVDEGRLIIKVLGMWRPKLAPEASRFIHIDLAKNQDLAGFSMCHVGDYADGGSPIVHQDLCVGFSASKSKPIDFDKIVEFIKWLREVGFRINLITYDSYQSVHSINILDKSGFKVKLRSMDILKQTPTGKMQLEYNEFRSMLALERVKLVDCVRLRREGVELQNTGEKPDHPESGSKDLIDATVGSFANAVETVKGTDALGDNFKMDSLRAMIPKNSDPKELVTRDQLLGGVDHSNEGVFVDP